MKRMASYSSARVGDVRHGSRATSVEENMKKEKERGGLEARAPLLHKHTFGRSSTTMTFESIREPSRRCEAAATIWRNWEKKKNFQKPRRKKSSRAEPKI